MEALTEFCFPTRCAGCDKPGELLCSECLQIIHANKTEYACASCAAPYGFLICTECWDEEFAFTRALSLGALESPLSKVCVLLKDANEQRLGQYVGRLLGQRVKASFGDWADTLTWVPPSQDALRRRGFDHGALLAQGVATILGLKAVALSKHIKKFDMRALAKSERKEAASRAFAFAGSPEVIVGRNVLLIDDVFTTGATLHAVSTVLLEAGAREVRVAVIARAW